MSTSSARYDLLAVIATELRPAAAGDDAALATIHRAAVELRQAAFLESGHLAAARGYRQPDGRLTDRYATARAALTPVLASEVRTA